MRRRWVAALILAVAIIFSAGGIAIGLWVIPEGKSAGDCEAAINYFKTIDELGWDGFFSDAADQMIDACHPGGEPG